MDQFNYLNDMNKHLTLDGELKNSKKPRWQRKMEISMNQSALSVSYNNSFASAIGNTTATKSFASPSKQTTSNAENSKRKSDKKSPGKFKQIKLCSTCIRHCIVPFVLFFYVKKAGEHQHQIKTM
jgi:hypothetical protein